MDFLLACIIASAQTNSSFDVKAENKKSLCVDAQISLSDSVMRMICSHRSGYVFAATVDGQVHKIDVRQGRIVSSPLVSKESLYCSGCTSSTQDDVCLTDSSGNCWFINGQSDQVDRVVLEHKEFVRASASFHSKQVLVATSIGRVGLLDPVSKKLSIVRQRGGAWINAVCTIGATIYVGYHPGQLVAMSKSGSTIGMVELRSVIVDILPDARRRLLHVLCTNEIATIDLRTGSISSFGPSDVSLNAACVNPSGTVFVGDDRGRVFAIRGSKVVSVHQCLPRYVSTITWCENRQALIVGSGAMRSVVIALWK